MDSRRDFLKKSVLLAAAGGGAGVLPNVIRRAAAIGAEPGTTYLDAEHVVILMQENRSFDHCYGTLRGVRGFDDPRAVTLPNGNPVWLQSNAAGQTYAPFRLNLRETRATWMGCLPHGWADQSGARNHGRHDRWLDTKRSDRADYADLPLTLGFYTRNDIPGYYALADAFTICDQNFCSSLTATTPNRLFLWTGTIRAEPSPSSKAHIRNSDADHASEVSWKTFPERLEENGIPWRVYQNELSIPSGLGSDAEGWVSNFGDNPLEYFTQFQVRFSRAHRAHLERRLPELFAEMERWDNEPRPWTMEVTRQAVGTVLELEKTRRALETYTEAAFAAQPTVARSIHQRAFATNDSDPHYRDLETVVYRDGEADREVQLPKGDVLHQFREDVRTGALPTVSWIVAPQHLSDHPDSAWYGAWYLAEVVDILTRNPAVWKKTIFILCYDENDGYFDHVPPFVPPDPARPETGRASDRLDLALEFVRAEQEEEHRRRYPNDATQSGPIGLGFRVPLVVASPWSRGGYVCSQVFDHTSILQFLEKILSHKTGREIREPNIGAWRRAICGDLTSVFRPSADEPIAVGEPVDRVAMLGSVHRAQFRPAPECADPWDAAGITAARENPRAAARLPAQEPGTRPSCALPYELSVHGGLSADRQSFGIRFAAGRDIFGDRAAGAPFHVYAPVPVRVPGSDPLVFESGRVWNYAVSAGDECADNWPLDDFADGHYQLRVHGPNGFFREFRGAGNDPALDVTVEPARAGGQLTGDLVLRFVNRESNRPLNVAIDDLSYGAPPQVLALHAAADAAPAVPIVIALARSSGWYDVRIRVRQAPEFEQRIAGRLEWGRESISDPLIGQSPA